MHYFSLNKKLLSTIAVIATLFAFCNFWFENSRSLSYGADRDFYMMSVLLGTLAAIGIALIVTAIIRTITFARGNRHQARYPVTVIAVVMIFYGILLSITAYATPITVEISVTSCNDSSSISIGIPECLGQITNPGLRPAVGVTIAGLVLIIAPIIARKIKRHSGG